MSLTTGESTYVLLWFPYKTLGKTTEQLRFHMPVVPSYISDFVSITLGVVIVTDVTMNLFVLCDIHVSSLLIDPTAAAS